MLLRDASQLLEDIQEYLEHLHGAMQQGRSGEQCEKVARNVPLAFDCLSRDTVQIPNDFAMPKTIVSGSLTALALVLGLCKLTADSVA